MKTRDLLFLISFIIINSIGLTSCSKKRVLVDECTVKGDIVYYDSKPFSGILFNVYPNGNTKWEQEYKNGVKNGTNKIWDSEKKDLVTAEQTFIDGQLDGLAKVWYSNGTLAKEANFKKGVEVGVHKEWFEDGKIAKEYTNDQGIPGYLKSWHNNGKLALSSEWNGDYSEQSNFEYFEDGKLAKEEHLKHSERDGNYKQFYPNGSLSEEGLYNNGQRIYFKTYNEDGTLNKVTTYQNDREITYEEHFYTGGVHTYRIHNYKENNAILYDDKGNILQKEKYAPY